uniref:FG-GAP repeat domain-containing protein n=1 Tax=Tabrizicola sp. TaxID=2005166 RepID=UPI00286B474C
MKHLSRSLAYRISILSAFCLIAIAGLLLAKPYLVSGRATNQGDQFRLAPVGQVPSQASRQSAVAVRAAKRGYPLINFQDGRSLKAEYKSAGLESARLEQEMTPGQATPVSLASEDVNGDGFPDLIAGYSGSSGGMLALHPGNPEAFAPKNPETIRAIGNSQFPDPFLANARVMWTPDAPDFLAIGDFNRDGKLDILTAAKGSNALHLLAGDGNYGFNPPEDITLSGSVTAMAATQKNEQDGGISIAVAINGSDGLTVLVYAEKQSILTQQPAAHPLPATATTMTPGRLDDDRSTDLAIVAGGQLYVLHGQAQQSSLATLSGIAPDRQAGQLEAIALPFAVNAVAISDFIWDRDAQMEMAVAGEDGIVRIIARGELDTRPIPAEEIQARRQLMVDVRDGKRSAAELNKRKSGSALRWAVSETTSVKLSGMGDNAQPLLMGTLASGQQSYDLLAINPAAKQLQIASREDAQGNAAGRKAISFDADSAPVAALPMRLNVMGRPGIVMLSKGRVEPVYLMMAPTATFAVTKTTDTNDGTCNADCSLREAVVAANAAAGADIITLPSGTYQLTRSGDDNTAANGDLDINTDITINGGGAAST